MKSDTIRNTILSVYEGIQGISYLSDLETYELYHVNNFTKDLMGEFEGKKCYEYIHGLDKPCQLCPNKRLLNRNGEPAKTYIWEYQNNKTSKWYEAQVKAIKWTENKYAHFEISRDITHRKRDEKSLLQIIKNQRVLAQISNQFNKEEQFERKIKNTLQILVEKLKVHEAFIVEYMLNSRENLLFSSSEKDNQNSVYKKLFTALKSIDLYEDTEFNSREYLTNITESLNENIKEEFNEAKIEQYALIPINVENENFGFMGIIHEAEDKTWKDFELDLFRNIANIISLNYKRKFSEEALIESEMNLRKVNSTKDKFFKIIAHDLKNPFSSIMGYSELLLRKLEKIEPAKTEQFVSIILHTSRSAYTLLENLLMWARSQDGTMVYNPEKYEINTMIADNITLLEPSAQKKSISVVTGLTKTIVAYCDVMMINTVIRNLISNAIKFTFPNGTISIDANISAEMIDVSVTDTGIGMNKEDIEKLFRIDYHHTTSGTENEKGTGLGLVLCKEFVERHGGKIWVESELGVGTSFYFSIPLFK